VDVTSRTAPDVVHDLNISPWPFADSTFDEITGYDVLEHIQDVVRFMQEIHRVGAPDAVVRLTVPHFSSANSWRDPTHVRAFAHGTLDYFTEGHPFSFYSAVRFKRVEARLNFHPSLLNRVVQRLARRWPTQYEDRWCWIFPAWFIYFELKAIKPAVAHADSSR
jgi:SAM-dependent methyltransferase